MRPVSDDPRAEVARLGPEEQVQFMVDWFMAHYEDPVHSLPWTEGDYVWLVDECHAGEELEEMFGGAVDEVLIEKAAGEVEQDGWQWVRVADLAKLNEDDPEPDLDDEQPEDDPDPRRAA